MRAAPSLQRFWFARGRLERGRQWVERLLAAAGERPTVERAQGLFAVSSLAFRQGDSEGARRYARHALNIANDFAASEVQIDAGLVLARVGLRDRDPSIVRRFATAAQQHAIKIGDEARELSAIHCLAEAARIAGDDGMARSLYNQSLSRNRARGNRLVVSVELTNLALLERRRGNLQQAEANLREAIQISRDIKNSYILAANFVALAAVAAGAGKPHDAARSLGHADAIYAATGMVVDPADKPEYEQALATARSELGEGDFISGYAEGALALDPSLGDAYIALGRAYRIKGWLREELQLWQARAQIEPNDANANEKIGWVLWFTGRADESLRWLETAVALRPTARWSHFFLGNANLALGRFDESLRMYSRALELHPDHSSAQAGMIWSLLAAHKDKEARTQLRHFQSGTFDGDRYPLKLADIEYFVGDEDNARAHARQALAEPDERYWPRGLLASTIVGALLWPTDRAGAEEQLGHSERIDRERLSGGDQGYMPHIDLTAVHAIRGDARTACRSFRAALASGWRYRALAAGDRVFATLHADEEFAELTSGTEIAHR